MARRWIVRGVSLVAWLIVLLLLLALAYVAWVWWAARAGVADVSGTKTGMPVDAPVTIARDARGVPHVRASSIHDLSSRKATRWPASSFSDGHHAPLRRRPARRSARLAGRQRRSPHAALRYRVDRSRRVCAAGADERALLEAFASGVNAAAASQPQPPEYRALFFEFEPWKAEDSLAVGFATVLDLDDKPSDVIVRDAVRNVVGAAAIEALYPITDPKYDVPTNGDTSGAIAKLPPLGGAREDVAVVPADDRPPIGSNGWVVGADRTTVNKAVLANDPHLSISIPTIWYLFEGSAPGMRWRRSARRYARRDTRPQRAPRMGRDGRRDRGDARARRTGARRPLPRARPVGNAAAST